MLKSLRSHTTFERQEKGLNVSGQSLPLAVLAVSTLRMKCFWSPYICIFASLAVSHPDIWTFLTSKVNSCKMMFLFKKVHNIRQYTEATFCDMIDSCTVCHIKVHNKRRRLLWQDRYTTDRQLHLMPHASYTTDKAVPFVTWRYTTDSRIFCHKRGHRQLQILSHARYTTDSSTFCHMQGAQRTAALLSHARYTPDSCTFCDMQGTQQKAVPLSHARYTTDSCTFCDMQCTQQTAEPFITCKVHNRQLHILSHARFTTDSCIFCHMQGTQQTAAPFVMFKVQTDSRTFSIRQLHFRYMQGTQQKAVPLSHARHNRQLHLCHMQGTQETAAPFVTCKVRSMTAAKFLICNLQSRLLRLSHLQGSQHTAGNSARYVIDRTSSLARYSSDSCALCLC